ncbi:polyprotein [Bienertia sinuspersici]
MAMLGQLATKDKLSSWGIQSDLSCVLCNAAAEDTQHLLSVVLIAGQSGMLFSESVGKEKEEKKHLEVTPPHEDVLLFYSDIMPLLGVQEDAFVWCMKYLQKLETPKGVKLADDEFILHVEGTASSQRVVRHVGGTSWPGRLTLTNYAIYFEALGTINYENSMKIDLSRTIEQNLKPASTGPWGSMLLGNAKNGTSITQSFLIFTLFSELPKGDYIIQELAETLKLIDSEEPCSASSILRNLNMPHDFVTDMQLEEQVTVEVVPSKDGQDDDISTSDNAVADSLATLDHSVTEVREQAKQIKSAKDTTECIKEEGVVDSALVLLVRALEATEKQLDLASRGTSMGKARECIGKALSAVLLWATYKMLRARKLKIGDKYSKVVVCTASDTTAMESIISAQQGLRTAHDLVQQVNIAILKIYSIMVSRAPKQANTVMMIMVGIAFFVAVVPFKFLIMAGTLYLFAMNTTVCKNLMTNDSGNRRLKEWWDSIPVIPVQTVDDPAEVR